MNFAVLVSGNGSNLQAIIEAEKAKRINAKLVLVVSDRQEAYALVRARNAGIPEVFINPKDFPDRASFDKAVLAKLKESSVDFVVLAGFMRILTTAFIEAFPNKIINIHPSLLPAFKGAHAIKDAFHYGVKVTGVTVHLVDEKVDNGEIIAQEAVGILPEDTLQTLETKIHAVEHKLYPEIISLFAQGKLKIGRRHERP